MRRSCLTVVVRGGTPGHGVVGCGAAPELATVVGKWKHAWGADVDFAVVVVDVIWGDAFFGVVVYGLERL